MLLNPAKHFDTLQLPFLLNPLFKVQSSMFNGHCFIAHTARHLPTSVQSQLVAQVSLMSSLHMFLQWQTSTKSC